MSDNPSAFQDVHTIAALLALGGRRVLDVGCGDGAVARLLASNGCRVVGIERDKELADAAREACDSVIVADAEEVDLVDLGDEPFDVLLCLDVLQHLVDPVEALRRLTTCLSAEGRVVASLPNVAHGDVRLQLLRGAFPVTARELLDHGQLRFFDRPAVEALCTAARLDIRQLLTVTKPPAGLQDDAAGGAWPAPVLDALTDPGASIAHFVFSARIATADEVAPTLGETLASALLELQDRTQARTLELEGELRARLDELDAASKELVYFEQALSGREAYLAELRRAADALEDRVHQADERCRSLEEQGSRLEQARAEAAEELETIKGWPAYRLIQRYDRYRQAHPVVVAPFRWIARRVGR